MISQNPADPKPQASSKPGAAEASNAVLDPHSPIEVASTGNGTTIDPVIKDTKPPAAYPEGDPYSEV
jgi:hypothetical protein